MDDFLHPTANPTGTLDVIVHILMSAASYSWLNTT